MKKKILAFFKKHPGSSFKSREIAKKLEIYDDYEYSSLKNFLHKLSEEDILVKNGKKYSLKSTPSSNKYTGVLQITGGGYGFVLSRDKKMNDVFIASRNIGDAQNGDTVEVALFANQKGKNLEGQVVSVLQRKKEEVNRKNIKTGSPDSEMESIAKEFNLPYIFPEEVLNEAAAIPFEIPVEDLEDRMDFRNEVVFTIDPVDAKDFDDALSITTLENGNYSVGVHIADVANYVKHLSPLDKEAFKRGNSVYLVGKVIPMLPEKLSNAICSLVPEKDRLTYSVIAEITKRGKLENYQIVKSVINSKRRFTYEEAQEIIDRKKGDFSKELLELNSLAQNLRKKRFREGSIDFFSPEVKFELDGNGVPVKIIKKEVQLSNMLVEEFMLLANKVVAKHIAAPDKGNVKPFLYRIHDLPDNEKIIDFAKFVKSLGYSFDPTASNKSKQFQILMLSVKGTEEEAVINELAIRSMAKAVYSSRNIGHYGLGFKHYTHFTSPIRRYSDLIVHRLLFGYVNHSGTGKYSEKVLTEISEHISITERNAVEAERLSVKLKQVQYLQNHIGEEFNAIISGVTHFGLFVKVTDILAEGLVKLRDLEGDFYVYDEKKYSLVGKRTKKQFRLGDKVTVKLVRVDPEKSEIDFIILE